MRDIKVGKVVLSIACGGDSEKVEKAAVLAERLTSCKPVRTPATRRARTFRVRIGTPMGIVVTMRKAKALDFLKKILPAVDNKIREKAFDNEGNFSFGLPEYLEIPGIKYDPALGIIGMNINVSLERAGFRVKRRRIARGNIGRAHRITKEEAKAFVKNLGVVVV